MNVLIPDDYQRASGRLAALSLLADHNVTIIGDLSHRADADQILAETEILVLIRERTRIDAALLARMPNLRMISQTGPVGRHIDIDACSRAGVAVSASGGSSYAPAEFAWLMIMAGMRRLPQEIAAMREGCWQTGLGREVHGKTLGILGFGKLGKMVAKYAEAFGMHIQIHGSERAQGEARALGYSVVNERPTFFSTSDVVSVHLRLSDSTRGSITSEDFSAMRQNALFVNTARAELIQSGALEAALRAGKPGAAAIDVYESEPIYDHAHPLLNLPNLICTPHLGYVAEQSYEAYFESAFRNVIRFCAGETDHLVNSDQVLLSARDPYSMYANKGRV